MTVKTCSVCSQTKNLDDFFRRSTGYRSECKTCVVENNKRRRYGLKPLQRTPKTHLSKTTEYIRWKNIKRKYNMTPEDWQHKLAEQGGVCDICKKSPEQLEWRSDTVSPFVVDHNATSGKVRGLLCFKCNAAIGLIKEDVMSLANAIAYLKKHSAD